MRVCKRFFLVLFLALTLLVVSAFPAVAEGEKIPISGTCSVLAVAPWGIEHDPDYRYWSKPDGMAHWRNQLFLFHCDFNDDRLDGYLVASDNWNLFGKENSAFFARSFGMGYVSDIEGNDLGLWDLSSVGKWVMDGDFSADWIYKGRGINQGLLAKITLTPGSGSDYDAAGELLVPEK